MRSQLGTFFYALYSVTYGIDVNEFLIFPVLPALKRIFYTPIRASNVILSLNFDLVFLLAFGDTFDHESRTGIGGKA